MSEPRERLAGRMRTRRIALGITKADAAQRTGVARNTWSDAENGVRDLQTSSYARVETTLQWAPGSIERILAGGEPTEQAVPVVDVGRPPVAIDLDYELDRVRTLDVPARTKLKIIQGLIDLAAQAQREAEPGTPQGTR